VNDFQEEMCRLRFLKIFLDVRMGYRIILLILILWFAHKKLVTPWKIRYVSDNVWEQKHFFDESSYIAKGVLTPEFCNKLIDTSRNLTYSKSNEPVDKEPLYQIDIFHGTKVIHEKLWDICKDIYYKHRVNHSNTDFMFLKRYLPEERVRIPLHFDTCKYTISFCYRILTVFKVVNITCLIKIHQLLSRKYLSVKSRYEMISLKITITSL